MADPRRETIGPQQRRANHSPLMAALLKKRDGEVYNACPFGCETHELDENGWCGHLIGFYNGGNTYEPRTRRKKDMRIIVSGKARKPMEKNFVLVRITTTARVYSPKPLETLMVKRSAEEEFMANHAAAERRLLDQAEAVRNPVLEGRWDENPYYQASSGFVQTPTAAATEQTE